MREYFAIPVEAVRKLDSTILKTRGDEVHAAFLTPDAALLASIGMQESIEQRKE